MKKAISLGLLICAGHLCMAQHMLLVMVKDARSKEPLPGATVLLSGTTRGVKADSAGRVFFQQISDGKHSFSFRFVGYEPQEASLDFPRANDTLFVFLESMPEEMGEVVISSTRSTRTIRNIPTRVELIGGEELDEKANMKPGDIRMLLSESTGIQTQQVSATSASSSIRIQGLDGRYTQILKDGFPLYAGFSGGLGLLQTPPLDLRQVEVIKGASSTLYGGGAIAGLVNLISKTPTGERDLRFIINATSARGLDLSGYYGQRFKKIGLTVLATRNSNSAYDPSSTGFTAIPKTDRYSMNPKLFVYFNAYTKMSFGVNAAFENRTGGDIQYIRGHADSIHQYFEKNKSNRVSTQFSLDHAFDVNSNLSVKNSVSFFDRAITIPGYYFGGKQWSTYSEISYTHNNDRIDWVAGLNVYTDHFSEYPKDRFPKRNNDQKAAGIFLQNNWKAFEWLQMETGIREDYVAGYGFVFLPRVAALFKISPAISSRLGGGLGYKTPTIFTEETERIQFQSVLPVNPQVNRLERSYGVNFDLNYRGVLWNTVSIGINQLFFFTRIQHPLILDTLPGPVYQLTNNTGLMDSKGWETNLKLGFRNFKLFVGYTFTDAHLNEKGLLRENPLTARHRLNNVLMYEKADHWKLGLEAYFFSKQPLTDGSFGKPFWTFGFMAEKHWRLFSLFINFENFTDTRQTRFDSIYTGTITHPAFRDIYAPLDGFVVNGGLKIKI
jgi:iron complex outermembrane receptor protein